jgi:hypothetical protein
MEPRVEVIQHPLATDAANSKGIDADAHFSEVTDDISTILVCAGARDAV